MPITIELNPRLTEMAGGVERLQVEAATVKDAVVALAKVQRGVGARVFNCEGELRSVLKIEVNGEPVAADRASETPLSDGDIVHLSFP